MSYGLNRRAMMVAWLLALWLAGMTIPARATQFALLVGVSEYPGLEKSKHLNGPRNDVILMRAVLERRGFAQNNMTVLADGVPSAALPTRASILAALDQTVAKSKSGDFVFIYFAGHGSRMPADRSTPEGQREMDGFHEIFLPRDVGKWEGKFSAVQNAIVNHELVQRLDAMTGKGVFVWAIFDSCHAANLMRSPDPDVRSRKLDPQDLGIPKEKMAEALAGAIRTRAATSPEAPGALDAATRRTGGPGGFVAFYAAQTNELTLELNLPSHLVPGDPNRKLYGLFGYTLAEALSTVDGVSYQQIGQYVLQRYAAMGYQSPTPLFSGTHLDAPVFGTRGMTGLRQWPIGQDGGLSIPAGVLNQVTEGAILAVVPRAIDKDDAVIGYLRVTKAEVLQARLAPVAWKDKAALSAVPEGAHARLVAPQVSFALRVVAPAQGGKEGTPAVLSALEEIRKSQGRGLELKFVSRQQEHDVQLVVEQGRVWMAPASGQFYFDGPNKTPSILIAQEGFSKKLTENLQKIGQALNLMRISSQLSRTPDAGGNALELEITLNRQGSSPQRISSAAAISFREGDKLDVAIHNKGRIALDLTVLYVDSAYGISAFFPYQKGLNNRLGAGGRLDIPRITIGKDTLGLERLVLIAVESRANSDRYDFSFLEQERMQAERSFEDPTQEYFRQAVYGASADSATRGDGPGPVPGRTRMHVVPIKVLGR